MKMISKYRPAAAAFLLMFSLATVSTAMSFLNQPVAAELGVGLGSFTLYYSLMVAVGAFTAPIIGQFMEKLGIRKIVLAAMIWSGLGLWLFSFSDSLWMFYVTGALMGILSSTAMNLTANVMLQTYYTSTEAANFIGIVVAGSGVGSMVYSALLPGVLENFGWRMAYRVQGTAWVLNLLLSLLVLGKAVPAASEKGNIKANSGMTRNEALRSPMLYLLFTSVIILTFGSGLIQHFPTVLSKQGYSSGATGAIISFYSVVLTIGKILQGILYGSVGVKKGSAITFTIYIAAFLLLMNASFAYPAFLCMGIGMGILTTVTPILTKQLFGQKEYAGIFGIVSMGMSVGSFVSTPIWGMLYDVMGSYNLGFAVMAVMIAVAYLLQMTALKMAKQNFH